MSNTRYIEEWRQLSWVIGCALATGYLDDEPPVSMLLLGSPGSGKSTLMSRWSEDRSLLTYSDFTSDSLRHHILPKMAQENRRHLFLPEFFKLFQRANAAVSNLTGVLSAAMSGELHQVMQGEREMEKLPMGFRIGVIGAMTDKVYREWSKDLTNTGMLDRFFVMSLEVSKDLREHMLYSAAMSDRSMLSKLHLPIHGSDKRHIHLGEAEAQYFYECVRGTKAGNRIRFVEQMKAMLKGLTLAHGEAVVTSRRVDQIHQLMVYILDGKPLEVE